MEIRELVAIVRAEIGNFQANMNKVGKLTNDFSTSWQRAGKDVATAIDRISLTVLGLATGIAAATAKIGISFRAQTENAEVMLTTLTGSAEKAKTTLAGLLKFSKETPFEFAGVRAAAIQFLNAKISAENLIPVLRKVGDSVASIGGGDEALRGVAMALSQMMTAGRVNAQDMMQLTNRGIAGWDMLAQRLGKSVAEVRKMSESGALDGRESAMMIIDEMGKRANGAADAMSKRFTGLWSSLKDDFAQFCDKIWAPLYTAMVDVMGKISKGFNSGNLDSIMNKLTGAVQRVVNVIMQMIDAHGEEAIDNLVNGFIWLADATAKTAVSVQQMMPSFIQAGRAIYEFLAPILEYMVAHPQLLAALVALKITGVMGLNTAFLSLAQALMSSIGLLGKLPALLAMIGPLMTALFAAPPVLLFVAALTAAGAAFVIYKARCDAATASKSAFDAAQRATQRQEDQDAFFKGRDLKDLQGHDAAADEARAKEKELRASAAKKAVAGDGRGEWADLSNAEKQKFAAEQHDKSSADALATLATSRTGAYQTRDDKVRSAKRNFGNGDKEAGREDLANARNSGQLISRIEKLQADYLTQQAAARATKQRADALEPAKAPQTEAQRKLEEKLRDVENKGEQKEAKLPGLDKMRDFLLGEGVTSDHARRYANAQNGATDKDAKEFEGEYKKIDPKNKAQVDELTEWFLQKLKDKTDAAKTDKTVDKEARDTANKIGDVAGSLSPEQIKWYEQRILDLNQAFKTGAIEENEYKLALGDLEQSARQAAQATKHAAAEQTAHWKLAEDSLIGMQKKVAVALGAETNTSPYMQAVAKEIENLQEKLLGGKISLADYKIEIAQLEDQTEKATKAERERRILAGDFAGAGLDPQKALQSKMAAIQEGRWNTAIDQMAQQMMGVGDQFQNFQNGMQTFGGQLQVAGNQIQVLGGQFAGHGQGSFDPAVAAQQMANLFNSVQGHAELIQNNIAGLQQNLELFSGNYTKQKEIQDQIDQLYNDLNNTLRQRQPILTPTNPMFMRDPGLQSSGGNKSVSINLPNVSRLTQADARLLTDTVANELNRRGGSVY